MSRILVTGAAGFTGRYLVDALAAENHDIHGIAHHPVSASLPEGVTMHVTSLTNAKELTAVVKEVRPDYVVHMAAIAFVAHGNIDEIYETNIVGTRHLLQALVDGGATPQAVLLASSANVYGNQQEGVIDEKAAPDPANDYAVSKLAMEYVARLYSEKLPIIIARPFNYTGVGQSLSFIIPKIVDHVRRRAPEIELGNIDVARDFSDVRSVADVYARLLRAPDAVGGVFNVCSGRAYPLREVLDMTEKISGHSMQVRVNPAFVRANEVRSLCGDKGRLEEIIGAVDMPPLEETLRWMLEA